MNNSNERLSKVMARRGLASRREADRLIEAGQVLVDGKVVSTLGTKIDPNAKIELTHAAKQKRQKLVTVMLNKPLGIVSTQAEDGYREAKELVPVKGLSVVGRLDVDSSGLLLLTQDGTLARRVIGPDSRIEKEYIVRVEGTVTPAILNRLRFGLALDGKQLKRAKVKLMQPDLIQFILEEGKKRQIRRMCELVGLKVSKLKRVRIGRLRLGDLAVGRWQFVDPSQI